MIMKHNTQIENTNTPLISIVMSAYNAEEYIREAIDSILKQSFSFFECIIIDDDSTIMHPDRLKIQYAIMEAEPIITVCGTWMYRFSGSTSSVSLVNSLQELIQSPIILFLNGNFLFHPTTFIRKDFWVENKLKYDCY